MDQNWQMRQANATDIDQIIAFNNRVFRPSVGSWTRELLSGNHPGLSPSDFSIVEDKFSSELISSMCLIKQRWLLEDVKINVGQLELVGTDERYRGRGLIRGQMKWFSEKLIERDCLLACVRGDPSLYQRFGFNFAVSMKGGVRICIDQIPKSDQFMEYSIRPSMSNNLSILYRLHNEAYRFLAVKSERTKELWAYQEGQSPESEHAYETFVIEKSGKIVGYFRLPQIQKTKSIVLTELAITNYNDLIATLVFIRELMILRNRSSLILQLPANHPALTIVRSWGVQEIPAFAWQVRIDNWKELFDALQSVFERRLSQSLVSNYTGKLTIFLAEIHSLLIITFNEGAVIGVEEINEFENDREWQLKATEPTLCAILLGLRSRAQLEKWHIEVQSRKESRYLIDSLFPKLEGFIYKAY